MHTTEPIPAQVESLLNAHGVQLPSLHLLLATDMTLTGHYSESWLGVDDKYVYMISPNPSYEQNGRSAGPGASLRFETYPLADIEEVRSVNMMGNGMLVLRTKQTEFVLRTMEERDVRFVRLWFTDVSGFLKSVAIAPAEPGLGPLTQPHRH